MMKYIEIFERFYQPSAEIEKKLELIIRELLLRYRGGKQFFDALDDEIKSIYNEDMILALVRGNTNEYILTSGEFGDKIYNLWMDKKFKCRGVIVFNGKIATEGRDVTEFYPSVDLSNKKFVYVDDSYFSGKTVQKISEFLHKENSFIKQVSVIYDGSIKKNKKVKSFFRYYK